MAGIKKPDLIFSRFFSSRHKNNGILSGIRYFVVCLSITFGPFLRNKRIIIYIINIIINYNLLSIWNLKQKSASLPFKQSNEYIIFYNLTILPCVAALKWIQFPSKDILIAILNYQWVIKNTNEVNLKTTLTYSKYHC